MITALPGFVFHKQASHDKDLEAAKLALQREREVMLRSDLVTDMHEIKHYYQKEMVARKCFVDLNDEIKRCNKCRLAETRKTSLCGEGHLHAALMIIAQAPGENENRDGRMFIGPSGKVLDERMRIDARSKTAIFSDGLTFRTAVDLFNRFHRQINTSFGIGTYLTNDCGFIAPQIVIKMLECNRKPVAKVSDSEDKGMCEDPEFLKFLKKVIREDIT